LGGNASLTGGYGANSSTAFRPRPLRDLRDRALIATLTYSFARITAALTMKVEDLRPQGAGWRLPRKNPAPAENQERE
jgi:hypothetical protein